MNGNDVAVLKEKIAQFEQQCRCCQQPSDMLNNLDKKLARQIQTATGKFVNSDRYVCMQMPMNVCTDCIAKLDVCIGFFNNFCQATKHQKENCLLIQEYRNKVAFLQATDPNQTEHAVKIVPVTLNDASSSCTGANKEDNMFESYFDIIDGEEVEVVTLSDDMEEFLTSIMAMEEAEENVDYLEDKAENDDFYFHLAVGNNLRCYYCKISFEHQSEFLMHLQSEQHVKQKSMISVRNKRK